MNDNYIIGNRYSLRFAEILFGRS